MKNVILAFGTRPEAIKMAPVYFALKEIAGLEPVVFLTGQHQEQLHQALSIFKIPIAADLEVMTDRQSLTDLAARVLPRAAKIFETLKADYVLVHGDTMTTFAVAWAAFLAQIPIGHVEAGLRSFNLQEPFPEEANRRLTDILTELDLAPTALAKSNLIREGKSPEGVVVTGQTGVDAVLYAREFGQLSLDLPDTPYVTVTLHRRENWSRLGDIARILAKVAGCHPEFTFIFPVHKNPIVREQVWPILELVPNFKLTEPLEYSAMASLLARSELIVTDSGGLQEEATTLQVPVVVVRNCTERPEGVEAGNIKLAGTEPEKIFQIVDFLLKNPSERAKMRNGKNPYGDGFASQRVAQAVAWKLGLAKRPQDWEF
ncbi:MAG: UDP-N-acetylglucosamine 2-epimerase (non-hydrolyzing) [Nitrospinae bacterium]|nr:UDP-N-acetylglucosamine 2-epimerase (non-hydrolyzing) [Nitrospinota bacterium]MDA1110542.1 UDP-N-acetylglucosamine 2-epimerase (non-hydrolyzing) [Nitrospinota bacterium]